MNPAVLRKMALKWEGLRLKPYRCTEGKLTIGVGRNIEDVGISEDEAFIMLDNDFARIQGVADNELVWFSGLDEVRQHVVCLMILQLGAGGFRKFRRFLRAMSREDYDMASKEMLDSDWAKQTPTRAEAMATMMRTGMYV